MVLMGGYSRLFLYAITGKELKKSVIRNIITKSAKIGEIPTSDALNESKIEEICKITEVLLLGGGGKHHERGSRGFMAEK